MRCPADSPRDRDEGLPARRSWKGTTMSGTAVHTHGTLSRRCGADDDQDSGWG
ncbi:hypothetical protein SLNWT_3885 [Streptomyces albus]|uniref:Uncharacterized protein n=1 Tax=Streptomyces albus (strain ATCC 21838 / DSM 41398 / FERM P-419 / JCM 4703 / NBRC 107858) TaxID=1081613 RepID=A0A0B5F065_STRA4|nr:hypothetical protein SLNWT_3885 [Streptomyces albus]